MYIDTDFEYLTFSILPTFKPGNKKRLFFGIGGYYSLLRGGSISVSMEDHITNSTITHRHVDIRNFVVKYDAGATAFAGYPFLFTRKGYASLQLSYSKGLVDVNDVWNHYQRNNTLLLIVAFNFGS